MELATARNADLAIALINLTKADLQAHLSTLGLFPSLSGGGSTSTRKSLSEVAPASRSFGVNLGLGYDVDLWLKALGASKASDLELMATAEDLRGVRQALAAKVVDAYYNLAWLADARAQYEVNLKNILEAEKIVALKHSTGASDSVEPIQAAQSVLGARDSLISNEREQITAERTLRDLLLLGPSDTLDLQTLTQGLSLARVVPPEPNLDVPLSLLAVRSDLAAADLRLHKAWRVASEATKAWLPTVSLSSAISGSGARLDEIMNNPSASVGLSISLPFLDWPRVRTNMKISEADYESAKVNFERTLTSALNEVEALVRDFKARQRLLENARSRYSYNLRVSAYYAERYQAGAVEFSDWLSAINTANSSGLTLLSLRYQLIVARNALFVAMGGRHLEIPPASPEAPLALQTQTPTQTQAQNP
jgi:outer membrane protein TolC